MGRIVDRLLGSRCMKVTFGLGMGCGTENVKVGLECHCPTVLRAHVVKVTEEGDHGGRVVARGQSGAGRKDINVVLVSLPAKTGGDDRPGKR